MKLQLLSRSKMHQCLKSSHTPSIRMVWPLDNKLSTRQPMKAITFKLTQFQSLVTITWTTGPKHLQVQPLGIQDTVLKIHNAIWIRELREEIIGIQFISMSPFQKRGQRAEPKIGVSICCKSTTLKVNQSIWLLQSGLKMTEKKFIESHHQSIIW